MLLGITSLCPVVRPPVHAHARAGVVASSHAPMFQHPQQLLCSCWGCCSIDAPGIQARDPISRIQGC